MKHTTEGHTEKLAADCSVRSVAESADALGGSHIGGIAVEVSRLANKTSCCDLQLLPVGLLVKLS